MSEVTLLDVGVGDILKLRCGGEVTVQKVSINEGGNYPIIIQIDGHHCHRDTGWAYNSEGEHGDGTGDEGSPFDIFVVEREARTTHLNPNKTD